MGQRSSAAVRPLCRTELGTARSHGSHHRFRLVRISVECLVTSAALVGLTALLRWISHMTCALLIGQLVVVCLPHQSHDVREVAVLRQADLCRPVAAVTSVPHVPGESFLLVESFNQDVLNGSDETGGPPCRTSPATEATETARKGNPERAVLMDMTDDLTRAVMIPLLVPSGTPRGCDSANDA